MHMRIANPSYTNSIYATFQKVLKIQLLQISWGSLDPYIIAFKIREIPELCILPLPLHPWDLKTAPGILSCVMLYPPP